MKNIIRILLLGVFAFYVASCEKKDDKLAYGGEAVLHFTQPAYQFIVTPSDTGYDLEVGTTTSASTSVSIAINPSSTAIEGVHFKQFSKSVDIGQGEFVGVVTIEPLTDALDDTYLLILDITNSSVPETVSFNQQFVLSLSRFCPLDLSQWIGVTFNCDEPGYAIYDVNFTAGTEPNTLVIDNFWDFGGNAIYTFADANSPDEATVEIVEQIVNMGGTDYQVSGSGIYEQCSRTMIVNYEVARPSDGALYDQNTHTFTLK